jgi:ankyrin repeat protein
MKYLTVASILAVVAPALWAAESSVNDRFYDAIRADDGPAVEMLLKAGGNVNARDSRGNTPLMYAAAVGSPQMMRRLIAAGADVNARNGFQATAPIWGANDLQKSRVLIENGADVNARSKQGRTPLLIAAAQAGNVETVRLLLKKGADPAKRDAANRSPLLEAAAANDTATVKLLLDRGEDVKIRNAGGFTPLVYAAGYGSAALVKALLDRGADVNAQTGPSYGPPVKNGPIAIGNLSPLMTAVNSGSAETVRLLLQAGADVNATDVRGMTPLMPAVATDHTNEEIIRMLLARRPAMDVKSKANETIADWAAKFNNPSVLSLLKQAALLPEVPSIIPVARSLPNSKDARDAAEKGIALLQKSSAVSLKEGGCLSCHAHNITTMAMATARRQGVHFNEAVAADLANGTRLQFAAFAEGMYERMDPPAVDILTYALFALSVEGAAPDRITDAMVHDVVAQQRTDGSWGMFGVARPPMMDAGLSTVATAIRGLRHYAPPAMKSEIDERIARAAGWLMNSQPRTTEDAVMQLLGAKWAGLDQPTIDRLAQRVLAI